MPGSTQPGRRDLASTRCGLPEVPRRHFDAAVWGRFGDLDVFRLAVTDRARAPGARPDVMPGFLTPGRGGARRENQSQTGRRWRRALRFKLLD
jgi:hypothetical protein